MLWLGSSLLILGLLFHNELILLSGSVLILYLLLEGFVFQDAVRTAKASIRLYSHPSTIDTTVGRPVKIETVIKNASDYGFRIIRIDRALPPRINELSMALPELTLPSRVDRRLKTVIRTDIPGKFEINRTTITFENNRRLFRQATTFSDSITIVSWPAIGQVVPIETGVLDALAVDRMRRGIGSDFAGIRPSNFLDDFHRIDWKATARTGKLMTREAYRERDPVVVLMIDFSRSMRAKRHETSSIDVLFREIRNLLIAIRPAGSSIGLILYDERTVIANVEARPGLENRERILRTLLERADVPTRVSPFVRHAKRTYASLAKETRTLRGEMASLRRTKDYWERFSSFANTVLPFYSKAQSRYLDSLREQGVFIAFEMICNLPEPVLALAISDGKSNFDGLSEGAKHAALANHRVLVAILDHRKNPTTVKMSSDLEGFGARMLTCPPEELSKALPDAILQMSRARPMPVNVSQ